MTVEQSDKPAGKSEHRAHDRDSEIASLRPGYRWFAVTGLVLLVVLAGACWWSIERARDTAIASTESRLGLIADGRVELIHAWREGVVRDAGRFADSQFLRAWAADRLDPDERDPSLDGAAGADARGEYLRNLARDFVERTRFQRLAFFDPEGSPLLGNDPSIEEAPAALTERAVASAEVAFGTTRVRNSKLVAPFAYPVVRPQSDRTPEAVVGVVVFEIGLTAVLSDAGRLPDLARGTETIRVLEHDTAERRIITADGRASWSVSGVTDSATIPFARAATDGARIFLTGRQVAHLPWTVVVSTSIDDALADWRRFTWAAIAVAAGVALAVLGGLAGLWFRLSASHARAFAEQERQFARQIDRERRLLDRITEAVPDLIGLKDAQGRYRYANHALAALAGSPKERLVGADDTAVFGRPLAERLEDLSRDAVGRDCEATILDQVDRQGEARHIRFSAQPFHEPDREGRGVLLVGVDLTEIVRAEQKRRAELERSVQALARAVETVDPYLAGHSRRLERLGAAVARDLRFSDADVTTVLLAARLSQVGKLAVRRELLTSSERHDADEIREMQSHVNHADRILAEIQFELPVRETVLEMYERLDGSGYPAGLSGEAIRPTARILGAVDVFCARIEPRSYRPPIDRQEALSVLRDHPGRYDADVVAALVRVVASPEGDQALADLAG